MFFFSERNVNCLKKSLFYINMGSSGGRVVKLLACGARGPGFDSPPRHLNFQRLVISCFQVEIWLKIAKSTLIKNNQQPTTTSIWPLLYFEIVNAIFVFYFSSVRGCPDICMCEDESYIKDFLLLCCPDLSEIQKIIVYNCVLISEIHQIVFSVWMNDFYKCYYCLTFWQKVKINISIPQIELVARRRYISLSHFIVLILIRHVLLYDTRQENYYFIRKVIDTCKRTKIKLKCSRGGGLNLCPLRTSAFPELKILTSATVSHSKWRAIKNVI